MITYQQLTSEDTTPTNVPLFELQRHTSGKDREELHFLTQRSLLIGIAFELQADNIKFTLEATSNFHKDFQKERGGIKEELGEALTLMGREATNALYPDLTE